MKEKFKELSETLSVENMVSEKKGVIEVFINLVERLGNKLPHPFWIFVILCFITLFFSFLLSFLGVTVTYVSGAVNGAEIKNTTVSVVNLLTTDQMRTFLSNFVKTYINFPPLSVVIVMMLGVGLIEQTGMISAVIRRVVLYAPPYVVTAVLVFVGINASIASDAGLLFTPTIGAAIFKSLGRNPWIGIIAGYAAASGGISASLFISGTDIILSGITESAAVGITNKGQITPLMNWYFMIAATLMLTVVLTFFTEKLLVKIIGDTSDNQSLEEKQKYELTSLEKKGLRYTGIAFIMYMLTIFYLSLSKNSFFRNEMGNFLPKSPLLSSILPLLFFLFFILGTSYGVGSKIIKSPADIPKMMQKQMISITGVLVTMFPAAMFVYLFGASKIAIVIAVYGVDLIKKFNIGGIPLILMLVILCSVLNLFMGSASAKWLILAPIFVPLFSMVGFSPALTQVAYRIGDGASNIISPIAGAVPLIIGLLEQYKSKDDNRIIGVGTMIALEIPFTVILIVSQVIMLIIWYIFNIPFGPGV